MQPHRGTLAKPEAVPLRSDQNRLRGPIQADGPFIPRRLDRDRPQPWLPVSRALGCAEPPGRDISHAPPNVNFLLNILNGSIVTEFVTTQTMLVVADSPAILLDVKASIDLGP